MLSFALSLSSPFYPGPVNGLKDQMVRGFAVQPAILQVREESVVDGPSWTTEISSIWRANISHIFLVHCTALVSLGL